MNYRVQFAFVILATFVLPALANGNSEMMARTALLTGHNRTEHLRSLNTIYPNYVTSGAASAPAAQISASGRNPKSAPTSSNDHGRGKRFNHDETLEIPKAIDSRSSEPASDEANADHQKYGDDLQLGPPRESKDGRQAFPGIARRLGTIRDYEDQTKRAPAAEVCIASQWWWTSGIAACTPITPSSRAAHRSPLSVAPVIQNVKSQPLQ